MIYELGSYIGFVIHGKFFKTGFVFVSMPKKSVRKKDLLSRVKDNPWVLVSFVLGLLLVGVLVFGVDGNIGEKAVGDKVVDFLNSQVPQGKVILESVEKEADFYVVNVNYQGDSIPLIVSLSGDYLFSDVIPLDESSSGDLDVGGKVEVDYGDAPFKGDEDALVTIVEWSDYECPFCARFYRDSLQLIEENYIETGKAKLVYMDFPLSNHRNAQKAAEAARCFGEQADYFDYHDLLFERQSQGFSVEKFKQWAVELGADGNVFDICLDSGKHAADVRADMSYGASLGITGTPGFLINGVLVSGAQPYEVFEQIIEAELAKA